MDLRAAEGEWLLGEADAHDQDGGDREQDSEGPTKLTKFESDERREARGSISSRGIHFADRRLAGKSPRDSASPRLRFGAQWIHISRSDTRGAIGLRSIALANQKGGVGKTTTAVHLAHGLALAGAVVVLIDLDPQGNATLGLEGMLDDSGNVSDPESPFSVLQALQDHLWLLPSPGARRNIDRGTVPDTRKLLALRDALAEAGVDWMIVDCPPRMDAWGWAGLELCERVLLPVQSEFFAMHGLSQMIQTLRAARKQFPGRAELLGVVPTMVDLSESITHEVLANLRRNLGDKLLQSLILRDLTFVEAASHGQTLFRYRLDAKGSLAYGELVREVLHGRT